MEACINNMSAMRPLRILHSIRSVNSTSGGPIEGLKQLSSINMAHGHLVEVVSLDSPNDTWVAACPVRCYAMGPSCGKYGFSLRLVNWIREHVQDYDIVVINGIWQFNAFGTWLALRGTGKPYFVFTHGMLDPWFKKRYFLKHIKKWLYWPWADYWVLRDATGVLFTCEEERRLARQSFWLYRCNEMVVNYGTAGPNGDCHKQRMLFFRKFPALENKRCLLFLGRVHPKKGADILLRAFAKALIDMPSELTKHVEIVMAGPIDHAYGAEMVALAGKLGIANSVTWTGMISGDLKWGAFHAADAFILPSHQENFGIAVAEALACRLPVLISDQVNIWREICNDGAGFVDSDTEEGTLNLIKRWLQTPEKDWHVMRDQARKSYEARFSIERAAMSLVKALRINNGPLRRRSILK